ncbi:uncharacterized protein LOC111334203 [Stylophora pistillata]|uniref:uncharacterized protein LOC111334203 n=1 Tax=Stylophora pistillata TaxID=50429 RepID=UPI000C053A32|nr:uncharacterized protein LOC111334203 [Stylophora pistillata]
MKMVLGKACNLVTIITLTQCVHLVKGLTVAGDDPWYQKASYYWPFNTLKDPGILDQRGTTSVQAYSKNGLQLDGFLGSWADLGNFSYHCISNPEACKTGFTATFWLRVDDRQSKRFVMQIGSATQAVGTTMQVDGDFFGVYVNGRVTQRHVQVNWTYASWVFVALSWNKTENKINVFLNCSSVPYEKYNVGKNFKFSSVPPNHMLILGASNARLNSIKMTIDELAIWNDVLSKQDVCYIMESKAVDGKYTEWSEFSPCTVSCGLGVKTRNRTCTNPPPKHGGSSCEGSSIDVEDCFLRDCPIHGNYSAWSEFSSCTLTCGDGKQYRTRTCTRPSPQYGGFNCSTLGPELEEVDCNENPCPIDGRYSGWSDYSECSTSCGTGTKTRTRTCTEPAPQYGGRDCTIFGPANEQLSCFIKVCPIDGNYSNWSAFSLCTKTCGVGKQTRTRKCDNPVPVGDGRNCSHLGPAMENQRCNTEACPVNGGYSNWSDFSPCTKSCAGGTHFRTRNCTNPRPEAGGLDCTRLGPPREVEHCNTKPCPVDGGYGNWSNFSSCSRSCGGGESVRSRQCNNPAPKHEGKDCSIFGPSRESRACNANLCPDISFVAPVSFPDETFTPELLDPKSVIRGALTNKIRYNLLHIYDEDSALDSLDVKWCGAAESSGKGAVVQCVLQFNFRAARYSGIIALQEALIVKKMLHTMEAKAEYISSGDVPSYAPENVTARNTSSRSIMVTWNKIRPHTVVGGNILGYRLVYTAHDDASSRNRVISGEENTESELRNLKIYTLYCVRVMGYNRRGDGIASFPVCAYTDKDVPDGAPAIVSARNLSSTELFVEWERLPEKYLHGVLLGYQMNLTRVGTKVTEVIKILPSVTSHRFSGLVIYNCYVISIAAINEIGVGVFSQDLIAWTDEGVPSRAPNISQIYYTSSTSIRVHWDPLPQRYVHGRLLGYRVEYRRVEPGFLNIWKTEVVGANIHHVPIYGLKKYGAYVFQVGAFTRRGEGLLSKGYMIRTDEDVPSKPPQNFTVAKDNSTSTSLFIHWRPVPVNHQNGVILGYRILYKKSRSSQEMLRTRNVSAESTTVELKNLSKYTEYDVTILAYTSKGNGVRAKFFTVSTREDRPSRPPTLTNVFNTSSTKIKVNWNPIARGYVHGVLSGYVVLYRAMNESQDLYKDHEVGPNSTGVELIGLWKYTYYGIRVLGFTRMGWGVISPEVVVQTDEDAPGRPPENIQAISKFTPTTIPVSWKPIGNPYYVHGILLGYTVTYRGLRNPDTELGEQEKNITVGPKIFALELRNLESFTIYSIEVRAFTRKGNGTPSSVIFAETCNCYRKLHTNYWLNPPYMAEGAIGNASGIFPPILHLVVRSCCGECKQHGYTEIDFRYSGRNFSAKKSSEKKVREAIDDPNELSFPVYGRMEQSDYSNEYGFAPLVQSAGVSFIVAGDEPGAAAKMVVKAVFNLWPLIVTVFISAFFSGIVMWLMDFFFNAQEFPSSLIRGPIEGMWWAFVTMTTLGYGDRVPRAIHSKFFGIVWITCGLVIIALVMSFITTSLTMDVIKSDIAVYGSKVSAIDDSPEFRLGIRLNARMHGVSTLEDLYQSLKDRRVDGALIDSYTLGSRKELFSDGVLRMTKIISFSSAYGVVMAGYARKLQKCFRDFLKEERASVFQIITNNVQGVTGLQKDTTAEKTDSLFDAESVVYIQTITWCGGALGVLTVIFLLYERATRKNRSPSPKRLEHRDYLESLNKQKPMYKYNNSKETMKTILTDFHKNCRLRLENLKAKHRQELRLLTRLKQEQADKGRTEALNGNVNKSYSAIPFRRSIVRHHHNGVVP